MSKPKVHKTKRDVVFSENLTFNLCGVLGEKGSSDWKNVTCKRCLARKGKRG